MVAHFRVHRSRLCGSCAGGGGQAIETLIGHTKADHRMDRCWLQGALGDALHALCCAAGYNIRWLLRAIARLGLGALSYVLSAVVAWGLDMLRALRIDSKAPRSSSRPPGVAGSGTVRSPMVATV